MKKEKIIKKTVRTVKPMARINTRITVGQQRFIKGLAKSKKMTEGEIFREIITFYRDAK